MLPDARQRLLNGQSSREKQAVDGFRNVVRDVHDARPVTSKGAKTVRHTGEAYEFEAPEYIQAEELAAFPHDLEPNLDLRDLNWDENDTQQERDFELANQPQDELPIAVPQVPTPRRRTPVRQMPHHAAPQQQHARVASLLSHGGLARLLVVLVILIGMAAAISWQWSAIAEFYHFLSHSERKSQIPTSRGSRPMQQKFSARVLQERVDGQAGEPAAPSIPPNGG
jgi:hypothetical protein